MYVIAKVIIPEKLTKEQKQAKRAANKQNREEYGKKKIIDNIHNGAVILLHATSKDNSVILESVINEVKSRGYEFKNIDNFER